MAHFDKYTRTELRKVWKETYRELDAGKYENAVDVTKSNLNYSMRALRNSYEALQKLDDRVADIIENDMGGKPPKLEPKFGSWVITAPKELQGDDAKVRRFFGLFFEFCENRYGAENIVDGVVHLDETSPHMTVYVVPACISRKSGKATISAATRFQRNELQSFHSDFDKICAKEFGIEHLVTRTDEEKSEDPKNRRMQEWRKEQIISEGLMDAYAKATEEAADVCREMIAEAEAKVKAKEEELQKVVAKIEIAKNKVYDANDLIEDIWDKAKRIKEEVANTIGLVDDAKILSVVDEMGAGAREYYIKKYNDNHIEAFGQDTPRVKKAKGMSRKLPDITSLLDIELTNPEEHGLMLTREQFRQWFNPDGTLKDVNLDEDADADEDEYEG